MTIVMNINLQIAILVSFILSIHGQDVVPSNAIVIDSLSIRRCPYNQELSFRWCCPQTCNPRPCTLFCTFPPRCACKSGFVKLFPGSPCIKDTICRYLPPIWAEPIFPIEEVMAARPPDLQ